MISTIVGGDRLPCNVSYCILVRGSESWTIVMAEHIRSTEDLHDYLVLFPSRVQNSLNSGGVVMFRWFSNSLSLPVGIGASFPAVLISSVESASRPPCGFWRIDDQQLEI
jgi:hypothetical protein